jgi:Flp pilus assembly protein CpaB
LKRSNRLVLLIGIFLALIAFMLIAFSGVIAPKSAGPSAAPTTTKVVVAARNVALGATFAEADITLKEIPLPAPVDSYPDTSYVVGKIARATVTAGQLIDSVVINGGGNIANIEVPAGRVAMSIKVDQLSGVGTVIKPGDYVDAMVAFNIKPLTIDPTTKEPKALDVDTGPSVKVLLQGLQVLGTLLPTPPPAAAPAEGATPAPSAGTNLNGQEQIVILSVSAQQAEVLNYSQITGVVTPNGISLLLRSAKDFVGPDGQPSFPPDTITTGIVLKLLVDQYGVLPPSFQVTALPGSGPGPSPRPSPSPSSSPAPSPTP